MEDNGAELAKLYLRKATGESRDGLADLDHARAADNRIAYTDVSSVWISAEYSFSLWPRSAETPGGRSVQRVLTPPAKAANGLRPDWASSRHCRIDSPRRTRIAGKR
jgi:hypothetical protein